MIGRCRPVEGLTRDERICREEGLCFVEVTSYVRLSGCGSLYIPCIFYFLEVAALKGWST